MKHRCAVLVSGLLVAAASQATAQAVQLRFLPPVGQVAHYRMVSRMWASGDTTAAPMVSTAYTTRTVTGMDGANYVVKTVNDSTQMVMPGGGAPGGRPGMGDMMRGMIVTQHLDPQGHVISSEITPPPGLPPFVANMMTKNGAGSSGSRNSTVWPARPVSPGYTWTDTMEQAASAGRGRPTPVTFIVTYKFERIEHQGGARVAIISMNGASQGGHTGTYTGEIAMDLDASRLVHLNAAMSMQTAESTTPMRMAMTMETLP